MLQKEKFVFFSEIHVRYNKVLCWKNVEVLNIRFGSAQSNSPGLKRV
jgi:hypothetical protein